MIRDATRFIQIEYLSGIGERVISIRNLYVCRTIETQLKFKYKEVTRSITACTVIAKLSKEKRGNVELDLRKINRSPFERVSEYRSVAYIDPRVYRCGIIAFACCTLVQGARKILFRMSDEWGYYSRFRGLISEICFVPSRFLNLLLQIRKHTSRLSHCLFISRSKCVCSGDYLFRLLFQKCMVHGRLLFQKDAVKYNPIRNFPLKIYFIGPSALRTFRKLYAACFCKRSVYHLALILTKMAIDSQ